MGTNCYDMRQVESYQAIQAQPLGRQGNGFDVIGLTPDKAKTVSIRFESGTRRAAVEDGVFALRSSTRPTTYSAVAVFNR